MKRRSASDPLTADDVAERLDKAALRVLRIMMDVRQREQLADDVRSSRYLTNALCSLAAEIQEWGIEPHPMPGQFGPMPTEIPTED